MTPYENLTQADKSKVHRRAILLNDRGYGAKEIARHLGDEGWKISYRTVEAWIYGGVRGGRNLLA